jgi:hypothetical protein
VAFVKALATMKVSPAFLKEMSMAIAERIGALCPAMFLGRRGTEALVSSHRSKHQQAAKWKATELIRLRAFPEPVVRGCSGRVCCPAKARWADQAHCQWFGPVQSRSLNRDGKKSFFSRYFRAAERHARWHDPSRPLGQIQPSGMGAS